MIGFIPKRSRPSCPAPTLNYFKQRGAGQGTALPDGLEHHRSGPMPVPVSHPVSEIQHPETPLAVQIQVCSTDSVSDQRIQRTCAMLCQLLSDVGRRLHLCTRTLTCRGPAGLVLTKEYAAGGCMSLSFWTNGKLGCACCFDRTSPVSTCTLWRVWSS